MAAKTSASEVRTILEKTPCLCVCRDKSDLYYSGTNQIAERIDLELVDNLTRVTIHTIDDKRTELKVFQIKYPGHIDRTYTHTRSENGWWADLFTPQYIYKPFSSVNRPSVRDFHVASTVMQFLASKGFIHCYTESNVEPNFSSSVMDFINASVHLTNHHAAEVGLTNLFKKAACSGTFLTNGSIKNPVGFNTGIITSSVTAMAKDLVRIYFPDLCYNGVYDKNFDVVYLIYHMLTEAIITVIAEMVLPQTLMNSGVGLPAEEYFGSPYLVFRHLGMDVKDTKTFLPSFYKLLKANVALAVFGDTSLYDGMQGMTGKDPHGFNIFLESQSKKYANELVAFSSLLQTWQARKEELSDWWHATSEIRRKFKLRPRSVTEMMDEAGVRELAGHAKKVPVKAMTWAIFEHIFHKEIVPAFASKIEPDDLIQARPRATSAYLVGQMGLLCRYKSPDMDLHVKKLTRAITTFDLGDTHRVKIIRSYFNHLVDDMYDKQIFGSLDAQFYKQRFPLMHKMYGVPLDAPTEDLITLSKKHLKWDEEKALTEVTETSEDTPFCYYG